MPPPHRVPPPHASPPPGWRVLLARTEGRLLAGGLTLAWVVRRWLHRTPATPSVKAAPGTGDAVTGAGVGEPPKPT